MAQVPPVGRHTVLLQQMICVCSDSVSHAEAYPYYQHLAAIYFHRQNRIYVFGGPEQLDDHVILNHHLLHIDCLCFGSIEGF